MSLERLLNQATPGQATSHPGGWNAALRSRIPLKEADAALAALAPDLARLLLDMADALARCESYNQRDEERITVLLARFAALNEQAG